jgi:hypothetical protein
MKKLLEEWKNNNPDYINDNNTVKFISILEDIQDFKIFENVSKIEICNGTEDAIGLHYITFWYYDNGLEQKFTFDYAINYSYALLFYSDNINNLKTYDYYLFRKLLLTIDNIDNFNNYILPMGTCSVIVNEYKHYYKNTTAFVFNDLYEILRYKNERICIGNNAQKDAFNKFTNFIDLIKNIKLFQNISKIKIMCLTVDYNVANIAMNIWPDNKNINKYLSIIFEFDTNVYNITIFYNDGCFQTIIVKELDVLKEILTNIVSNSLLYPSSS